MDRPPGSKPLRNIRPSDLRYCQIRKSLKYVFGGRTSPLVMKLVPLVRTEVLRVIKDLPTRRYLMASQRGLSVVRRPSEARKKRSVGGDRKGVF